MTATQVLALSRARSLAATGEGRRIREAARLSLTEVAAAIGVERSTLHRWEIGDRRPRGDAAVRYVELLDDLREALPA